MLRAAIYYGTMTGNTERIASEISAEFFPWLTDIFPVSDEALKHHKAYDLLLFGTSTWGVGILPDDWKEAVPFIEHLCLAGQKVALFGLGNQGTYPDTFADGLGILYGFIKNTGCEIIGSWEAEQYEYARSRALEGNHFCGLVLDEDNQPELTHSRIVKWVAQLKNEMGRYNK